MSEEEKNVEEFLEQVGDVEFTQHYQIAIQKVNQKLEKTNLEYSKKLGRTFISLINHRVKTPESCLNKLQKKKSSISKEDAIERLNDIAGVRVVCSFLDDIYKLAEILEEEPDWEVVKRKDYVRKPKSSGYQSLHLIMLVPVNENEKRKVEIQIRTQAMNFWAVVEHHFVYKKGNYEKVQFEKDLKECAKAIYKIDKKMLLIREKMEQQSSLELESC